MFIILLISLTSYSQKEIEGEQIGYDFNGEVFGILKSDGFAIVDKKGNIVIDKILLNQSDPVLRYFSSYKGVTYEYNKEKDLYRLIDFKRNPITDYKFKTIHPFKNDITWAENKNDEIVYINFKGKEVSKKPKEKYTFFGGKRKHELFFNGLKQFDSDETKLIGFKNYNNQIVITAKYNKASNFSEELVCVAKLENGRFKWGFIDKLGNTVIPFKFSNQPNDFKFGKSAVLAKNRKYGYINKKGEVIIQPKYQDVTDFYKNFALVKEGYGSNTLLINEKGEIVNSFDENLVVKVNYNNLKSLVDDSMVIAIMKTDFSKNIIADRTVIIDKGKNILSKRFSEIKNLINGFAQAKNVNHQKNFKEEGLINSKGEFIVKIVESKF